MAHKLSFMNGKAEMAYTGETPWHGFGTRVEGLQTAQDMLRHAGLLWTVSTRPLFTEASEGAAPSLPVSGFRAVVRDDNHVARGVVSDRYQPIQNTQAGDVMQALIAEGAAVEVAGALERWISQQEQLAGLYREGVGSNFAPETAWSAYNAVTEYVDHVYPVMKSGKVSQARLQSAALGSYADIKGRAMKEALSLAK